MPAGIGSRPIFYHGVAWNRDPNDPITVPVWTDQTAKVIRIGDIAVGRQYELAESMSAEPTVTFRDPDEDLNPANESGPYYGDIRPYRELVSLAQWNAASWAADGTNDPTGNLLNENTWQEPYDTSFESYPLGVGVVPWITGADGGPGDNGAVSSGAAWQGNQKFNYTVTTADTRPYGAIWTVPCIPGVEYTSSVYVRQDAANTQLMRVLDQILLADAFTRDETATWGTPTLGDAYTLTGTAADFSVDGARGLMTIPPASGSHYAIIDAGASTQNLTVRIGPLSLPATNTIRQGLAARHTNNLNNYTAFASVDTNGVVTAFITERTAGVEATLGSLATSLLYDRELMLHFECDGVSQRMNLWDAALDEPEGWMIETTDGTQTASNVGAYAFNNSATVTPVFAFDNLQCIASVGGTSTTTIGSYVRLEVTWTATRTEHTVQMATSGTRLASLTRLDAVQHEQASSPSAWSIDGPVIYPIMRPYLERFPRTWTSAGFEGWCLAPGVDALAALSGIELAPEYVNAVQALGPLYYWPLSEGAGATAFLAGEQAAAQVNLYPYVSKYGAGEGVAPGTSISVAGNPGATGVRFVEDSGVGGPGAAGAGTVLAAGVVGPGGARPGIAFPPAYGASWSASISCWIIGDVVGSLLVAPYRRAGTGYWIPLSIFSSGGVGLAAAESAVPSASASATGTTNITDGVPHHLVATITQDATNTVLRIYTDGALEDTETVATSTLGGLWTIADRQATSVSVGGFIDASPNSVILSDVALWSRQLTGAEISSLYQAGAVAFAGETPGERVVRHLVTGGYAGASDIDVVSTTTMQAPSHNGSIALRADVQNNAVTEDGVVWADASGQLVFEGRALRWDRLEPSWTFGEDEASGEIPYQGDLLMDYDPMFVYANVQIERPGGATAIGGTQPEIATARLRYFPLKYSASVDVEDDDQAQEHADWTFNTHKDPLLRVAAIEIDPASNPSLWGVALGTRIGQRVRVTRRATAANAGAGLTITRDFFLESITHSGIDMDTRHWRTIFLLSPVGVPGTVPSLQPWILEDATYGVLDSTTILGF